MKAVEEIAKKTIPGANWNDFSDQRATGRIKQKVTLDSLETSNPMIRQAVATARAWAERKREGQSDASLIIVGPYGAGKTHIAKAILWSMTQSALDDNGKPMPDTEAPIGRFFLANDLIQQMEATTRASHLIPVGNELVPAVPVLVIDDVGAEQQIEYAGNEERQALERQHRYFKVIEHCYVFGISVVMTSNLALNRLAEHVGGRCWSRLQEMAPAGFMVDLTGVPDWRKSRSGR